jgi:hypothetical protein
VVVLDVFRVAVDQFCHRLLGLVRRQGKRLRAMRASVEGWPMIVCACDDEFWLAGGCYLIRQGWMRGVGSEGRRRARPLRLLPLVQTSVPTSEAPVGLIDPVLNVTKAITVLGLQAENVNPRSAQACDCCH